MTIAITRRPPNRSAMMPMNRRDIEPDRIGVPTSRPSAVSDRLRSFCTSMPMIEKMVHSAKEATNPIVLAESAHRRCPSVTQVCSGIAISPEQFASRLPSFSSDREADH